MMFFSSPSEFVVVCSHIFWQCAFWQSNIESELCLPANISAFVGIVRKSTVSVAITDSKSAQLLQYGKMTVFGGIDCAQHGDSFLHARGGTFQIKVFATVPG